MATLFQYRPMGMELELAQRYYSKIYNLETDPGTATNAGYVEGGASSLTSGGTLSGCIGPFPLE